MKTAVDEIGRGKARTVHARFRAMTGRFLFEPDFCNPGQLSVQNDQQQKAVLRSARGLTPSISTAQSKEWRNW